MTPDDEIFVAGALKELAQHLKVDPKDDPIKLSVSIKRLGDEPDLAKEVDPELNRLNDPSYRFSDSAAQIVNIFVRVLGVPESFVVPRLLVYCHKDSQVAKAALREKPSALWGCTCGFFGAVYQRSNKFSIWHEAVHLLLLRYDEKDECYEPYTPYEKKDDCECDTCIMQYEPPKKWAGEWSLCDKIIGFLRDLSKNCRENKQG